MSDMFHDDIFFSQIESHTLELGSKILTEAEGVQDGFGAKEIVPNGDKHQQF